ncbi:AAA family ATPase [Nocardia sp. NEAU-G5]|uniref:AAA family ATPase n=1 Tax=Nocardia albiluteola TaxID=2842303 RepID=A0ABS6AUV2_9NOCA|nr:helix-turn-helix transcriptional regulator [Nocardia albiluteola]MBU3060745.1 AAA family ATPase [Nocardia albiluteola]
MSDVLVGRAGELTTLLEAVTDERTSTVLIGGDAGIGKSRLVGEFTSRLGGTVLVLAGRCPEFGSDSVPFAPFLGVVRDLVRGIGIDELVALLPPGPALAHWHPALAARAGTPAAESDRVRLFGEILTVLELTALVRPVVVVLEDLHWADRASLDLLSFLITNLAEAGVLLVGTHRPAESGRLRELLAELGRNPAVRQLLPQPLTRYEVGRQLAALLGAEADTELISRVFERSQGNPLFVEALSGSRGRIPDGLTELLLGFTSGLRPASLAALRGAAVIGSPVHHELLSTAVELDSTELDDAVRELIARRLLETAGSAYEFRHVLIRQAVYEDVLPAERARLHAVLAAALRARPELLPADRRDSELALHALCAGDLPCALAASWRAATAATSADVRMRELERVLELWDRVPAEALPDTTKSTVLEQLVRACADSGAIERGIAVADTALAQADSIDPLHSARMHYRRACLRGSTGAGPGADLNHALRLLPSDPPGLERGEVLAELALNRVFDGDPVGAAAAARESLAVAQRFGSLALAARAHAYLGLAEADDASAAMESFARARAAAREAGDPRMLLDVAVWESSALVAAGGYETAVEVVQQGLRTAHETFRFAESAPILLVKYAQALHALGRWPDVLVLAQEARFAAMPPLSRAALQLCHAKIALAQGDSAEAGKLTAESAGLLGEGEWARPYRLQLRELECLLALEHSESSTATAILADLFATNAPALRAHPHDAWPLLALAARLPDHPPGLDELTSTLTHASPVDAAYRATLRARLGVVDAPAEDAARDQCEPARDRGEGGRGPGEAAGTPGRVVPDHVDTERAGDGSVHPVDEALGVWGGAVRAWRALGRPYELAQSLVEAASVVLVQGDRGVASSALREARAISGRLGAEPLTAAIDQVAARARLVLSESVAAERDWSEPPARTFGLTRRELDVLGLIARGLSNRGIGAELFISANTAGVHVSRILTKLGVASRTEAAAFAHEHGLLTSGNP